MTSVLSSLRHLALLAIALPLFALTACDNDDDSGSGPDTNLPQINLVGDFPVTVLAGNPLNVRANLTDDRELLQVEIAVHNAFDGHAHDKTNAAFAWDTVISTGAVKNFTLNLNVLIPVDASTGPYHVMIGARDRAGNADTAVYFDLNIVSASAPGIDSVLLSDTIPPAEVELTLEVGTDSLPQFIRAEVSDDQALDSLWFTVVKHEHGKTNHDDEPIYVVGVDIPLGATLYAFTARLPFRRADLMNDTHYVVRIRVRDADGNNTVWELPYHVFLQ